MSNPRTFLTKLDTWTPLRTPYRSYFSDVEIETLFAAIRLFQGEKRTVVIAAFENTYAYLGGLAAVTRYLPRYLKKHGERIIFISPLYKKIPAVKQAIASGEIIKKISGIPCKLGTFQGLAACYQQNHSDYPIYYLDCDGFFTAGHDPYTYADKTGLLFDALVFSCAVPFILKALNLNRDIIIHTHDWETALIALSTKIAVIKGILDSVKSVLTLHNSYDEGLPDGVLEYFLGKPSLRRSVLQTSIPLLDGPLTTVSEQFAAELMHDPLQREVFADHLQHSFSMNAPIGIGNGPFKSFRSIINKKILAETNQGKWQLLNSRKIQMRRKLLALLSHSKDTRIIGKLTFKKEQDTIPLFFMSGRFDIMQKGFDVIFHAFKRVRMGSAKLIFSPSNVSNGTDSAYTFFSRYTSECEGDITVWPFIIPREIYRYFISGSSYLVMPSFYEPFGAATEGFVNGTPVIARATGGLWDQIVSVLPCTVPPYYASYSKTTRDRAMPPCGILYHEEYAGVDIGKEWRSIFSSLPDKRMSSKLYSSMVDAAYEAIKAAIEIFQDTERYNQLIENGRYSLERFSWDDVAEKYRRIYSYTARNML